jgi:NADPH-dependent curcumin reductase CurA
MADEKNVQVRLAARPEGMPGAEHWRITEEPVPELTEDGQVLVKVAYISLDPAMRGWLRDGASYIEPVGVGDVMRAGGVGTVVASRHPDYNEGDQVLGVTGVQSHAVVEGKGLTRVNEQHAPLPAFLGALGMPGLTAYFGLLDVGAFAQGNTVLVSGAAGAVGSVVGQIARNKGAARVVGIAGSDEKCQYIVEELGFDAAINYKTEPVRQKIAEHCPDGVDVYFDNVGGDILDDALLNLSTSARVVICGAISQYNNLDDVRGPKNYLSLLVKRARMQGFVIFDYTTRYPEAFKELAGMLAAGKLRHRETIVQGIETFPETFLRLFSGDKQGKLIIKV